MDNSMDEHGGNSQDLVFVKLVFNLSMHRCQLLFDFLPVKGQLGVNDFGKKII